MTFNDFNIKKLIKYVFIAIVCILCFNSCNVKALNYSNYRLNIVTGGLDLNDLLYSGDSTDLGNFYQDNFNSNFGFNYSNDVKDYVIDYLGYNSFSEFEEDYYYIISYKVYDDNLHGGYPYPLSANIFYVDKQVGTFDVVLSGSLSTSSPNSSNETHFYLAPSIDRSNGSTIFFGRLAYNQTYNFSATVGNFSYFRDWYCWSNYTFCRATRGTNVINAYLVDYFDSYLGRNFFDSNFDFDFVYDSYLFNTDSSPYYFTGLTINNTETIYNFGDKIGDGNAGYFPFTPPNITDLGNNSYGINLNSITNVFLDFSDNDTTTSINCPSERDFTGNVCYLYVSDIENYDNSNTNVSNSAIFYLGGATNFSFDSSKYYVITFRVYSVYDLDILTTIYNLTNDSTDYPFNIQKKYYKDYTLYKDFSLVIQPTHSGSGYIQFIDIVFNTLDNYTNTIVDNYSFGIFKTIKISQYDTLPTQTDVENEISNNSLTTISNNNLNSFFTDFRLNDYGLSPIVLYPLNFANSFVNYTCSSLSFNVPHLGNVSLPCVSSFMSDNFSVIWNLYKLIFNGLIIYRILINMYGIIKNSYAPDNDRIEVVDL